MGFNLNPIFMHLIMENLYRIAYAKRKRVKGLELMPHRNTIAVCLGAHSKSSILIRAAAHRAKDLGATWKVIYVETPHHYGQGDKQREKILELLTLAEQLGAEICHIEASSVRSGIVRFLKESYEHGVPIRHLIIGQTFKEGFFSELRMPLAEKIMKDLRKLPIETQIIPLTDNRYVSSWFDRLRLREVNFSEIFFAFLAVFITYTFTELLKYGSMRFSWETNAYNVSAFFLVGCIVTAMRFGLLPGLICSVLSFLTICYVYVDPAYSFIVENSNDSFGLAVFLISAVLVSLMGAFSKASNSALVQKEKRSQALFKVHRLASEAETRTDAFKILHKELTGLLEMDVAFFLPSVTSDEKLDVSYPENVSLTEDEKISLEKCWHRLRTTGLGTLDRTNSQWRFEPLATPNNEIGVMGIKVPTDIRLDASFGRLLTALADQAASILERIELTNLMSESRMREEREKLRSMLLSSVSHDLKTPLASVIGSLSVYKRMIKSGRLDAETAEELTDTALEEAQRLDSFISNILDMTRIESGDIKFSQDWVSPEEVISNVSKRLRHRLLKRNLIIKSFGPNCFVSMDQMMTEQVLQNIIDNAVKYSPEGTDIFVEYGITETGFSYQVRDLGPGIPEGKEEAIFDKYERLRQSDRQVAGTGLGLAIAQAVMESQGGTVTAKNHPEGGAVFTVFLPKVDIEEKKGVS